MKCKNYFLSSLTCVLLILLLHKKITFKKSINCEDEISKVLKKFKERFCEVKVSLMSGANCCEIKGKICDIRKNDKILILIGSQNNFRYYIPVDKISAVCEVKRAQPL